MIQKFYISIFLPIFLSIFFSIFFIPFFQDSFTTSTENEINFISSYKNNPSIIPSFNTNSINSKQSNTNFLWPTPGYSKITSDFGYRKAPTAGAGTYHGGIDIAAPENSSIISIANGTVSFIGWYGANGYTVIIQHLDGYKSIYGHISPDFLVELGNSVKKGEVIAKVGPKYVEKKSYTTYYDKNGKCTNGATTGPHLHFSISKDNKKVDPKKFF